MLVAVTRARVAPSLGEHGHDVVPEGDTSLCGIGFAERFTGPECQHGNPDPRYEAAEGHGLGQRHVEVQRISEAWYSIQKALGNALDTLCGVGTFSARV